MSRTRKTIITVLLIVLALVLMNSYSSLVILFLPGYWLLEAAGWEDTLEKLIISFALSVALVSLSAYGISMIGIPVTAYTILGISTAIIMTAIVYLSKFKSVQ